MQSLVQLENVYLTSLNSFVFISSSVPFNKDFPAYLRPSAPHINAIFMAIQCTQISENTVKVVFYQSLSKPGLFLSSPVTKDALDVENFLFNLSKLGGNGSPPMIMGYDLEGICVTEESYDAKTRQFSLKYSVIDKDSEIGKRLSMYAGKNAAISTLDICVDNRSWYNGGISAIIRINGTEIGSISDHVSLAVLENQHISVLRLNIPFSNSAGEVDEIELELSLSEWSRMHVNGVTVLPSVIDSDDEIILKMFNKNDFTAQGTPDSNVYENEEPNEKQNLR